MGYKEGRDHSAEEVQAAIEKQVGWEGGREGRREGMRERGKKGVEVLNRVVYFSHTQPQMAAFTSLMFEGEWTAEAVEK